MLLCSYERFCTSKVNVIGLLVGIQTNNVSILQRLSSSQQSVCYWRLLMCKHIHNILMCVHVWSDLPEAQKYLIKFHNYIHLQHNIVHLHVYIHVYMYVHVCNTHLFVCTCTCIMNTPVGIIQLCTKQIHVYTYMYMGYSSSDQKIQQYMYIL